MAQREAITHPHVATLFSQSHTEPYIEPIMTGDQSHNQSINVEQDVVAAEEVIRKSSSGSSENSPRKFSSNSSQSSYSGPQPSPRYDSSPSPKTNSMSKPNYPITKSPAPLNTHGATPPLRSSLSNNSTGSSRHISRSDSERSDTSSYVTSPRTPGKSSAVMARAAFWNQRIEAGESSDNRVLQDFPELSPDSFKE